MNNRSEEAPASVVLKTKLLLGYADNNSYFNHLLILYYGQNLRFIAR
jgi:hypothetical protein